MGIFFGVLIPFIAGYELMDSWVRRTEDPRVLKMRAEKAFARQNAIKPPETDANKLLSQKIDIVSGRVGEVSNRVHALSDRVETIAGNVFDQADDIRDVKHNCSELIKDHDKLLLTTRSTSNQLSQLEIRMKEEIKKALGEHAKQKEQEEQPQS